ncbi:hypothetical protein ACGFYU_32620 [Streptomyces sp. NPDC048337]|uniref:hypothetical protein n=1 Tax=Streptomyces sp. NPDC048337 TaxID=3365535 RepID=UPI0037239005
MGTTEDLYEVPDDRAALLVRDAMDRTTADLPPLPDLTGAALAQGRRRKARVRVAIGGGVLAVAAIGVAGAVSLSDVGGGRQVSGTVNVAAPPSGTGPQPPVHLEPTPGESSMADLPAAERTRQENFQNQAVGVLQALLPPTVGTVQRTDLNVRMYQGTKDGKTFVIIFSIRPSASDSNNKPCADVKGMVCKKSTLPGGIEATAVTMPVNNGNVTETELSFRYGKSNIRLAVAPHDASNTSAPVTNDQLLELAKDPAFIDLVKTADANPLEQPQQTIPGG